MKKAKIFKVVLVLTMAICLFGCSSEQTEDIYVVYTNDVAGQANGQIGYAGVKGYTDYLRSEHKYVALVDAGDFLEGTLANKSNGTYITQIMNAVGYDVVTVGNQDFSLGLNTLANAVSQSEFSYVSCNLKYQGSGSNPLKKIKPYIIKRYGPTKIAYIGVTTPETILESGKSSYEALMKNDKALYYLYEDNQGEALYEQIQKTVDKVRKRVDYVILLSHLGSNNTIEGFNSYDVITHTNGIDVVIDGHSHTVNHGEAVSNKDGEMVVLTSTGQMIENLGVLEIHPDHTFTTVLYPSVYESDATVQALVDELYSKAGD